MYYFLTVPLIYNIFELATVINANKIGPRVCRVYSSVPYTARYRVLYVE